MTPKEIKQKILSREIKTFTDLVNEAGSVLLAQRMGCEKRHIETISKGSGKVYLKDLCRLCEALDMTTHKERGMVMELWVE